MSSERIDAPSSRPEFEGPVTILFTDVEGSTDLHTQRGDVASHEVLRAHDDIVRKVVADYGGRAIKSLGDGLMVAFASPKKAVACSVAIQRALHDYGRQHPDRQLRVRIGLNTGEVIADDGDLYGEAVNAAARIAARAKGGEIIASSVVKDIAGTIPDVSFRDRGRVRLKGFPERRQLYEIVWVKQRVTAERRDRTPYVGRESERAELMGFLDRAIAGQGALVMIGGEPGIGKTRIAEEIAAEGVKRGMLALTGRCYETETAPPYIPFVEILETAARGATRSEALRDALGDVAGDIARIVPELRRMFPDIPRPVELPPEQERRYLFNAVGEFMERAARVRPEVIVVDDLQWADDSSLLLLQHLAERLHELPVLILGTYRDVELDLARPLANTLGQLVRRRLVHRVSLKRLPEENVGQMLSVLAGSEPPRSLVHALYGETEGNPFFVEEVFKYLSEEGRLFDSQGRWRADLKLEELDVPEGVRLVIGRRLERLSEQTRKVLSAGAVIGRSFNYELLEALEEVNDDALLDAIDEAERARLVVVSSQGAEDRLTFAHELIRHTLASALSAPRRRRVHLRIADAMEQCFEHALDEHAANIAYHLEQAGGAADPERTAKYMSLAGRRALEVAAYEDALRYFENALSLQGDDDVRARAELLYGLGLAQRSLGNIDDALVTWRKSLACFEALGEIERVADVSFDIAQQLAWASKFAECLEVAARGLEAIGDVPSKSRARLLGLSAVIIANNGDHDNAMRWLEEADEIAHTLGDEVLLGYGKAGRALVYHAFVEFEEEVSLGMEGLEVLRKAEAMWDLASYLGFIQFALFFLGRWDEAHKVAAELEPLARRLSHFGALVFATRSRPHEAFLSGDLDRFEEFVAQDLELAREVGPLVLAQARVWQAFVHFWRGDWEQAEKHFVAATEVESPGFWRQVPPAYLFLFRSYAGQRHEALAMFDSMRAQLPQPGRPNHWGAWATLFTAIEGLLHLGDKERVAAMYPLLLEVMEKGVLWRPLDTRFLETLAGMAAGAGRQWDAAERHFEAALTQAERYPFEREKLDARRFYAAMLIDRGSPRAFEKARAFLAEAGDGYRRLGMRRHVEIAEALLRRADGQDEA